VSQLSSFSGVSAGDIRQIEQICDRFEAAWKSGDRPRLESYLAQVSRPLHRTVLRHLVALDWEYQVAAGEQPSAAEYKRRFPLISEQVDAIFREVTAANSTSASHPVRLGKYRIIRQVGRGGMGVVYEALDETQARRVAIKLIPGIDLFDPNSRERFWREAHTTARLNHPNIVQIIEVGEHEGNLFLALEFVAGPSLSDRLRQSPQPPKHAAALVETLARAVQHAHDHGIVHRDLKPANVLLAKNGTNDSTVDANGGSPGPLSEFTPKLTDFGLAQHAGLSDLTATGDIVGTPGYMAPEQACGKSKKRSVGPAADVYALGAILYAALTGRAPFQGATVFDALEQVRSQDPVPPTRFQPHVPRDLETICLKCLEKEPGQRYVSAAALADDLRRFLMGQPIRARRASQFKRLRRWCRRNPAITAIGILGVVAVAAAAGLVVSYSFTVKLRQEQQLTVAALREAQYERARASASAEQLGHQQELTKAALIEAEHFRRQAERVSASFVMERGLTLLEQNEIARGMLVLGHSLKILLPDAADLERVIRINLAAAQRQLPFKLSAVLEHGGEVQAATFSPDGQVLLTGGRVGGARRWDAVTGEPIGQPLPHEGEIRSVTYSLDGRIIATAGTDKTARLWDAATSEPIGKPLVHAHWVQSVAISPDSRTVVSGSADGTARIWDLATGEQRGELRPPGWVHIVAFSADGKKLATGSGNRAQIWDAQTLEPITESLRHQGEVWSIAFSPDNHFFVTGSEEGVARFWETESGKPAGLPLSHQEAVRTVGYSADGKTLWTGGADGKVRLWDVARMTPLGAPVQHQSAVYAVAMSHDQTRLAAGSVDGKVRIWEKTAAEASPDVVMPHERLVYCAAFSPDGKTIATGTADNNLRLWDASTGQPIGEPITHANSILRLTFSADGQTLMTACTDNTARLWNVADGSPCGPVLRHDNHVYAVAFSPDGRSLLTASKDSTARLWDAVTGRPRFEPLQHPGWIHAVAFSPDGSMFVTGCEDGAARVWDVASGRLMGEPLQHRGPVRAVAFSPDGQMFVTGTWDDGTARFWDAATRKPIRTPLPHLEHVLAVAFSADGKSVATGAWDGTARLWDVATGKRLGPPLIHQRTVRDVAFSPDCKTLLTASFDRTARSHQLPVAVEGSVDQVLLWIQVLTGMTLDDDGLFRDLDADSWNEKRGNLGSVSACSRLESLLETQR
jgi:WD40 repeat protein/serine/threonine protein kinase